MKKKKKLNTYSYLQFKKLFHINDKILQTL